MNLSSEARLLTFSRDSRPKSSIANCSFLIAHWMAGFLTCQIAALSSIIVGLSLIIAALFEVTENSLNRLKAVFGRLFNIQTYHLRRILV